MIIAFTLFTFSHSQPPIRPRYKELPVAPPSGDSAQPRSATVPRFLQGSGCPEPPPALLLLFCEIHSYKPFLLIQDCRHLSVIYSVFPTPRRRYYRVNGSVGICGRTILPLPTPVYYPLAPIGRSW